MDFLYGCDQEVMYVAVIHPGDVWRYRQYVGFSSPRMLEQVQHVYVIAEESSWELLRS